MPSDLELVRQLGSLQADVNRMASKLELMRRDAEAAPTRAEMVGKRFMFHKIAREDIQLSIVRMTAVLADLLVLINELKARYYPERHVWTKPPSQEMIRAVRDAELAKLIQDDEEKHLAHRRKDQIRMTAAKQKKSTSGLAALLSVIS